jgi:hypothetical protein
VTPPRLPPRLQLLLTWLRRMADAGRPLPGLDGIADGAGILNRADVSSLLRDGERLGLLVVEYGRNGIAGIGAADGSWYVAKAAEKTPVRRCLACRQMFQPDHRHNFLCGCNAEHVVSNHHYTRRARAAEGA